MPASTRPPKVAVASEFRRTHPPFPSRQSAAMVAGSPASPAWIDPPYRYTVDPNRQRRPTHPMTVLPPPRCNPRCWSRANSGAVGGGSAGKLVADPVDQADTGTDKLVKHLAV